MANNQIFSFQLLRLIGSRLVQLKYLSSNGEFNQEPVNCHLQYMHIGGRKKATNRWCSGSESTRSARVKKNRREKHEWKSKAQKR